MTGKVILVGAGPGHPGLLTLRGREALEQATVVVYDRLVGLSILYMIPYGAQCIDVGKEASFHKVPQEEINRILVEKALQGHVVVRLKGGDPFLFGRGGEEIEALQEYNIPFEVVPGVSSSMAAPSFGGIPLTHRDVCSSVHVITGHPKAGRVLDIDFSALVRTKGTLVFLMGVSSLPMLMEGLLLAGIKPDTPAAIVENGTTSHQRRIEGTVETLEQRAKVAGAKSPSVIVVGQVCAYANRFAWFDKLPLRGKTVVVTRPVDRRGELSRRLTDLGAYALEYPCIETKAITPCPALEQAVGELYKYQWLCFTSAVGVACFWQALTAQGLDARALSRVKLAVVGPATAKALQAHGLHHDLMPKVHDGAHLGALLSRATGDRILIVRAENGAPDLVRALAEKAVAYDDIGVYKTVHFHPHAQDLRGQVERGEVRYASFTSVSTVKGFMDSLGAGADVSGVTAFCIGRQTAQEAERQGMIAKTAGKATMEDLLDLICKEIGEPQ